MDPKIWGGQTPVCFSETPGFLGQSSSRSGTQRVRRDSGPSLARSLLARTNDKERK